MIYKKKSPSIIIVIVGAVFAAYAGYLVNGAWTTGININDFINKLNGCQKTLKEDLKRILNIYNKRHKALSFEYNHIFHKIEFRDIVNIEKEQDSKRCIIRTTYGTIYMPGTLNDIISKLDDRLLKVHRSLIVNKDKIVKYSPKLNKLEFNDGSFTHLISRRKKKELMKCD